MLLCELLQDRMDKNEKWVGLYFGKEKKEAKHYITNSDNFGRIPMQNDFGKRCVPLSSVSAVYD